MDWKNLSLGERIVTVARRLAAEHVRQELHAENADLAQQLQDHSDEMNQRAQQIRQDLFRQPSQPSNDRTNDQSTKSGKEAA